ncbi:MAG: DUF4386 domain-containing protein [Rhodoglobus sp.]
MTLYRRLSIIAGALYLVTFATSFPALALKTGFLTGGDPALAVWGAILEIGLAASAVGTALALYPITRRISESLALSFVVSRTVEGVMILSGVLALMSLVTIRAAGTTPEIDEALVAWHDWTFLLGPAFISAINALLLGTILYRARLVPRIIPLVGILGAPLLLTSSVAVLFGAWAQTSPIGAVAAIPIALWELSLGLWLIFRGVREHNAETAVGATSVATPTPTFEENHQ